MERPPPPARTTLPAPLTLDLDGQALLLPPPAAEACVAGQRPALVPGARREAQPGLRLPAARPDLGVGGGGGHSLVVPGEGGQVFGAAVLHGAGDTARLSLQKYLVGQRLDDQRLEGAWVDTEHRLHTALL